MRDFVAFRTLEARNRHVSSLDTSDHGNNHGIYMASNDNIDAFDRLFPSIVDTDFSNFMDGVGPKPIRRSQENVPTH